MRITCDSCGAKYNVADEKVQGKTVKIRCKKCSNVILVNNKSASAAVAPSANEQSQSGASPPQGEALYHVNVAENDQRELRMNELVEGCRAGWLTGEMYVWTEGMADWAPLEQVEAIASALRQESPLASVMPSTQSLSGRSLSDDPMGFPSGGSPSGSLSSQPSRAAAPAPSHPVSPLFAPSPSGPSAGSSAGSLASNGIGSFAPAASGSAPASDGAPVEARRVRRDDAREGRDLFAAPVGSDPFAFPSSSQHIASADARAARPTPPSPGLTGERSESSVLFNVGSLAVKQPEAPSKEDSGIIDLRALVASNDERATPAVEATDAPIVPLFAIAPSSVDQPVTAQPLDPARRKSGLGAFIALASAGLVLAGGAVVAVVVLRSPPPPKPAEPIATTTAEPPAKVKEVADPSTPPPPVATTVSLDDPNEKKVGAFGKSGVPAPAGGGPKPDPGAGTPDTPPPAPVVKKPPSGDPCGGDLACMMKNSVKKKPK